MDKKPELILMGGLPSVGKSYMAQTMAQQNNTIILDVDEIGRELSAGDPRLSQVDISGINQFDDIAQKSWQELWKRFTDAAVARKTIIIDACHHFSGDYRRYTNFIRNHDYRVRMVLVEANLDTVLARNRTRTRKVAENVIRKRNRTRHSFLRQRKFPIQIIDNN